MITPTPHDAKHKIQLIRILSALVDDVYMARWAHFKGGTCAAMLGYLDRFSVDLDFDIDKKADMQMIDSAVRKCCSFLGIHIRKKSSNTLFYLLKYSAPKDERNTLKLSFMSENGEENIYEKIYIPEIDRLFSCQTIETMFSNKLVALTNRYIKNNTIAVRDVYDIHHFFEQGYRYNPKIITLRTGKSAKEYLYEVAQFIEKKITETNITNDLSFLLEYQHFQRIRKTVKRETITLINDEIRRLTQ